MVTRIKDMPGYHDRVRAKDLRSSSVFGTYTLVQKQCLTCKKFYTLSNFYLESKSNRKDDNDTRNQCVTCWLKTNGRIDPRYPEGNTLEDLLSD